MAINVQHPVNGFARGALLSQHQSAVFWLLRKIVGDTHCADARLQTRLVCN